ADYCSNAILKSIDEMNPDFNISETLERIDCMTVVPNAEAYYPEDDKPRFGMLSYPYTPCRIYSEAMTGLSFTETDLFSFADAVIDEVNKYIVDDTYCIKWLEISFEDDYETLVMDVIDSDNYQIDVDIRVDFDAFISDPEYRQDCIAGLTDYITEVYGMDF
ncbi:MAG: hypothetical protein HUJ72_09860, partial [Blautia sp.]|nr:hypothetical protein [Blautia sp.]